MGVIDVVPPGDGKVVGPYTLSQSPDIGLFLGAEAGRSYSFEVMLQAGSAGGTFVLLNIHNLDGCPATDSFSGFTVRDTTGITPNLAFAGARRSFVVNSSPFGHVRVRVHNAQGSASFLLSYTETTMFSQAFSTFATDDTFYWFRNTTNATINATLTLLDTAGTAASTLAFSVPTDGTFTTDTVALGTPRNIAGSATLIHDGPPGAIHATAAINAVQAVPFEARRR